MLGGYLGWTSIPSRGRRNTPSRFLLQKLECRHWWAFWLGRDFTYVIGSFLITVKLVDSAFTTITWKIGIPFHPVEHSKPLFQDFDGQSLSNGILDFVVWGHFLLWMKWRSRVFIVVVFTCFIIQCYFVVLSTQGTFGAFRNNNNGGNNNSNYSTVEPVYYVHPQNLRNWLLNTGKNNKEKQTGLLQGGRGCGRFIEGHHLIVGHFIWVQL